MAANVVAEKVDRWEEVSPLGAEDVGGVGAHPDSVHPVCDLRCVAHAKPRLPSAIARLGVRGVIPSAQLARLTAWITIFVQRHFICCRGVDIPGLLDFAEREGTHL